jgi:hypothetical protein
MWKGGRVDGVVKGLKRQSRDDRPNRATKPWCLTSASSHDNYSRKTSSNSSRTDWGKDHALFQSCTLVSNWISCNSERSYRAKRTRPWIWRQQNNLTSLTGQRTASYATHLLSIILSKHLANTPEVHAVAIGFAASRPFSNTAQFAQARTPLSRPGFMMTKNIQTSPTDSIPNLEISTNPCLPYLWWI